LCTAAQAIHQPRSTCEKKCRSLLIRDQPVRNDPKTSGYLYSGLSVMAAAVRKGTAPTKVCPLTPWTSWKGCQWELLRSGRDEPRTTYITIMGGAPTAMARSDRLLHSQRLW